jgi:hypothetical protein
MFFLSAFEDFVVRTLAMLSGPLSRLAYLGTLRSGAQYQHWGLARAYGDAAAAAAISEAHTQVWLEVLRTPVRKLVGELETASNAITLAQAADWRNQAPTLTPANLGGGSQRHFHSILLALSLLSRSTPQNSEPAA